MLMLGMCYVGGGEVSVNMVGREYYRVRVGLMRQVLDKKMKYSLRCSVFDFSLSYTYLQGPA